MLSAQVVSSILPIVLNTNCVLVLYRLGPELIDHVSHVPNPGLLVIGDTSEADHWREHKNPTQSQSECFLAFAPMGLLSEIGQVLSLARKKQLILLEDGSDFGNISGGSTLSNYTRIRKRFDRPLLLISGGGPSSVVASLVCFDRKDSMPSSGDKANSSHAESFTMLNLDTFKEGRWRMVLGGKFSRNDLSRLCNLGRHPLKDKHLVTITHTSPPTAFFKGDFKISEGVEVEVGNVVADRLGFGVTHFYARFHFLPLPGNLFGGALGDVYHQRADVSFAGPLIIGVGDGKNFRGLRLSSTDFLTSYSYGYFIPRPKELPAWSNLFLAFDLASWALLLASLAFVTLVQTAAYLTSAEEAFSLDKLYNTAVSTYGVLFQECHFQVFPPAYDRVLSVRFLRIVWVICSFLLIIAFAGNLKAVFVVRTFEDPIDTVQSIKDRKLKVMMSSDFFYYTKTLQATGTPISETHVEMTKLSEESNGIFDLRKTHYEDAYHLAGRNGTVVLGTHRMHGYLRVKYLKQGKVPPLISLPYRDSLFQGYYVAYASTLEEYFNSIFRDIVDFGIYDKYIRKYSSDKDFGDNLDRTGRGRMGLEFLVYPFGFIAVMLALSAGAFLLELGQFSARGPKAMRSAKD